MTRELFNLAELLAAAGIGVCVGGVGVFLATVWMRNDAAADRIVAAGDLAKVAAGLARMEAARSTLLLAPAYQAHTAQFEMIRDEPDDEPDEPFDCAPECRCHADDVPVPDAPVEETAAVCCTGHGDEPCAPDSGLIPAYCCDACPDAVVSTSTALVLVVDEPPVTADDLAPIGPAHMPAVTWRGWALLAVASVPVLVVLVLLALVALVWLGADRTAEWWADRRRRRDAEAVELVMAHPAPVVAYDARHRAPAGRWWWSR